MILDLINHIFVTTGMRWRIGGTYQIPSEFAIKGALDEAARLLYTKDVGDSLTVESLGLHIVKTKTGHQAYILVGDYE